MERFCTFKNNIDIQEAHKAIPQSILDLLHFDYFIGCNPIFAGLINHELTEDGRSYRETACVSYPFHQSFPKDRRKTTIIIPQKLHWVYIVHEIGHILDEFLGFDVSTKPVSEYAKTNRRESFAEAFTSWLVPRYAEINLGTKTGIDLKTENLFKNLVR